MRQYAVAHPLFPQQTTGDQFYDEAQWEAYRRLGEHAILAAFDGRAVPGDAGEPTGAILARVATRWIETPPDFAAAVAAARRRALDLESTLRATGYSPATVYLPPPPGEAPIASPDAAAAQVEWVARALEHIDATFVACQLASRWSHPFAVDLISAFRRWVTLPFFRAWYPLLRATVSRAATEWFEERVVRTMGHEEMTMAACLVVERMEPDATPDGDVLLARTFANRLGRANAAATIELGGFVRLGAIPGVARVQVAAAWVRQDVATGPLWRWSLDSRDLVVPPPLWNAGFGTPFLRALCDRALATAAEAGATAELVVTVARPTGAGADPASRANWARELRFYREAGFVMQVMQVGQGVAAEGTQLVYRAPLA